MSFVFQKSLSLLIAIVFLLSSASLLLSSQTIVFAADSNFTSASDFHSSVSNLPISNTYTNDEIINIAHIAQALVNLSSSEKMRVSRSSIESFAHIYNIAFNITEPSGNDLIDVDNLDEIREKRILQNESYVYGVAAVNHLTSGNNIASMFLEQFKTTSSSKTQLSFKLSNIAGPVAVELKLNGSPFSSSKNYTLKWDSSKLSSINVGSNYIKFVAPGNGNYKLYLQGDEDDEEFWNEVIDDIKDARSGDTIRVNTGSRKDMPTNVLDALDGRSVTLILKPSSGTSITIYGKNITSIPNSDFVTLTSLRNTYSSSSSSSKASSSSHPSSSIPEPGGGSLPTTSPAGAGSFPTIPPPAGAGTTGSATPPRINAPTFIPAPAPLPSSEVEETSLEESSAENSQSEPLVLPMMTNQLETDTMEVFRHDVMLSAMQPIASDNVAYSKVQVVVESMGMSGIVIFLSATILTFTFGCGLFAYAILLRN